MARVSSARRSRARGTAKNWGKPGAAPAIRSVYRDGGLAARPPPWRTDAAAKKGAAPQMISPANDAPQHFYHGTRADLKTGDLIAPGFASNYGRREKASWVYLTATLDAA